MAISHEEWMDLFCAALEMKEKKKALYDEAIKTCSDAVAQETYRFLSAAEQEHRQYLQQAYEQMKAGKSWAEACKIVPEGQDQLQDVMQQIARQQQEVAATCTDDIGALESALQLEEASIRFFEEKLARVQEEEQRELLERLAQDERRHRLVLADLKYYYADPQGWYMEKSGARLDGAGDVT